MDVPKDTDILGPSFRADRYSWFQAKLGVDLMQIDEDIIQLPALIQDAGECAAIANEIREKAKEDFEHAKASIAQSLREHTQGKKPSETMIESQLPLFELYKNKLTSLSQSRLDSALWATMVEALRSKSAMIRVSADLLNSGLLTTDYIRNKRRSEIRNVEVKIGS